VKTLLLVSVAALLMTASANARPKFKIGPETVGAWCGTTGNLHRCSEDEKTSAWVTITPTGWDFEEGGCKIISGKIIGKEAAHTKALPWEYNPVYRVRAKCYAEGEERPSFETYSFVVTQGSLLFCNGPDPFPHCVDPPVCQEVRVCGE
jgi:hypothetical protein